MARPDVEPIHSSELMPDSAQDGAAGIEPVASRSSSEPEDIPSPPAAAASHGSPSLHAPPVQAPPVQGLPIRLARVALLDPLAIPAVESPPTVLHARWSAIRRIRQTLFASPTVTSFVFHAWLLLILAWLTIDRPDESSSPSLMITFGQQETALDVAPTNDSITDAAERAATARQLDFGAPRADETPMVRLEARSPAAAAASSVPTLPTFVGSNRNAAELMLPAGIAGGGWQGRGATARGKLLADRGGTPASERAVERGLRWLAAHQLENGSWSFNHQKCPQCGDLCRHPGTVATTTGATALALLPFLGDGITHLEGEHHEVVRRGIYFLGERMIVSKQGGDLQDGTMYAQGLATIALCEAYAMSGDANLRDFAQAACDFIVHAQHAGGGWRYLPGQPGDTTVFGWQLMALKSGQMAGLEIPPATWYNAARFLDQVQSDEGASYGYQEPGQNPTMTSIGLLSRMYLGWPQDHPALQRGADHLAKLGPSENSLYFNYYATQVLQHLEGPRWTAWNDKLRNYLERTQATEGHESGSWYFEDSHTKTGGRLYNTAMATMILEVYYRYLPLYSRQVLDGQEFAVPE